MREIKFRVWNGLQMVYDITVGKFGIFYVNPENGDGLNPQDTASLTVNTTKYSDGIDVMQYTGLKDKNGKEIYEGDIVQNKDFIEQWDEATEDVIGVVELYDGCFGLVNSEDDLSNELPLFALTEIEVIGNVYDNPELLKQ